MAGSAARPISGEADPFACGDLEDPEIARRIEVPLPAFSGAERPEGDRVRGDVKSRLPEDAHRTGHMKGGCDQQPSLRQFGAEHGSGETGVLVSVEGLLLQSDAGWVDPEFGEKPPRLRRLC